jgi:MEMO1 family protein
MTTPLESLPEHIRKPHLRPIQPIQVTKDGQQLIALRDPLMISQQMMVVPPPVLGVLQHFRGERGIEEIATQHRASVDQFVQLAQGLDQIGLLWGPTFEQIENEVRERVRTRGAFPPIASATLGKDEAACRDTIKGWLDQTEDPEIETRPAALVAPHLDYQRGWPNYAAAYHCLREVPAPDRVVILGTNHFGLGDGVVLSEFGFDSPLGRCPADEKVVLPVIEKLGRPAVVDQLDHLAEHSVELHLPWLQYFWGNVPVVAALIPDPLSAMIADDGERITTEQFLGALTGALDAAGGSTFFIASSDLSHVGPQFGEPRPVDDQRKMDVERHDREMMGKFLTCEVDEFLGAMRWTKNPTRWCSVGNMAALLMLVKPQAGELLDYRQACDEQGAVLVSSAAMAMM